MKELKNGHFVLTPNEVRVLAELICNHPEDPREQLQDLIREDYGDDSIEEFEMLYAIEGIIDHFGIGCNESFNYVPLAKRAPMSAKQIAAKKLYVRSLKALEI